MSPLHSHAIITGAANTCVTGLEDWFLSFCRRKEPIIAIGGGVCLDIAGLFSNLYRRNTPVIKVCNVH